MKTPCGVLFDNATRVKLNGNFSLALSFYDNRTAYGVLFDMDRRVN